MGWVQTGALVAVNSGAGGEVTQPGSTFFADSVGQREFITCTAYRTQAVAGVMTHGAPNHASNASKN